MPQKNRRLFSSLLTAFALGAVALPAWSETREVVIGYQDMVLPWRYAQETQAVEKATGYKISYRKLASGAEVTRALASGAIQIGEAGSSPFAAALSQGVPIQIFWVADNIHNAEALVARNGSNARTLADLKGKKIGIPYVSTSHFHALVALQAAGLNAKDVKILNLRPPEILAAWERGDIDAAFVWDPVLAKIKQSGQVLTTSGEIAAQTGKATFDALAVRTDFAQAHGEFLTRFVKVLAEAETLFGNLSNTANISPALPLDATIALEAPPPGRRSVPASLVWVPGCAGLMMAGDVILTLAGCKKEKEGGSQ